jgi:low affinity Fe/Cu permease
MSNWFSRAAHWTAQQCGHADVFILAVLAILLWVGTGPLFGWSDTWQLVINTGTTIVTFLMVFLIQNTQNRDTAAIQLKLDELIRASQNARNVMLGLEDLSEDELKRIKDTFAALAEVPERAERMHEAAESLQHAGEAIGQATTRAAAASDPSAAPKTREPGADPRRVASA